MLDTISTHISKALCKGDPATAADAARLQSSANLAEFVVLWVVIDIASCNAMRMLPQISVTILISPGALLALTTQSALSVPSPRIVSAWPKYVSKEAKQMQY
jgi:hypothetical protein